MALVSLLLANVPSMEKRPQFDSLLLLLSVQLGIKTTNAPMAVRRLHAYLCTGHV